MNEVWIIKAVAFLPKLLVAFAGVILALVLSGDIDKEGKVQLSVGLLAKFTSAVCISIFGGAFVIENYGFASLTLTAQLFIVFLCAVFGLLIIGIIYQSIALMKGKPLGDVIAEIVSAFISIFSKGGGAK